MSQNVACLNFVFEKCDLPSASGAFRAVGYGHGAATWKTIIQAYMDVDYDGILSIENEGPILTEKWAWREPRTY
jgi:sugar phosphate isomerase/epimerase